MNRSKRLFAVVLTLVVALSMMMASVSVNAATKPTKLYLKSTASTVDIGGKVTVTVYKSKPSKASKSVTWKSSNKKIATVSSKGVVTGKKTGKVKITATSKLNKKVKVTKTIRVKNLKPTKVKLNKTTATLQVGDKTSLKATVSPVGLYNKGVTWSSSDEEVAKVSSGGTVTAVSDGEATITVKTKESGKTAKCKVTVTADYISAKSLYENLGDDNTVVLDVRKVADYKTAHIPTAVPASTSSAVNGEDVVEADGVAAENIKSAVEKYSADKKYVLVCYSGNRYANEAYTLLKAEGVKASNLAILGGGNGELSSEGGMKAWNSSYADYVVKSYTSTSSFDFNDGITPAQLKTDVAGDKKYTVVDLRTAADYDRGHIPGSVNAAQKDNSAEEAEANLKAVVDKSSNAMYVLVCYSGNKYANQALQTLTTKLNVPDEKCIVLEGGNGAWDGDKEYNSQYMNAETLYNDLTDYVVLDVRKAADYKTAHIPTAVSASCEEGVSGSTADGTVADNIGAAIVKDDEGAVDTDAKYAVVCYSGNRYAQVATNELIKKGVPYDNVLTLGGDDNKVSKEGGMKAWNKSYAKYVAKSYKSSKGFDFNDGITAEQLKADVNGDKKYVVLDLRTADLFEQATVDGAINAVQKDNTAEEAEANLKAAVDANEDAIFVLVCYSGNNYANQALQTMTSKLNVPAGRCIVLDGGYAAYEKNINAFKGDYVVDTDYVQSKLGSSDVVFVDARGIDSKTQTLKGAITMTWQQISKCSKGKPGDAAWGCTLDPADLGPALGKFGLDKNKEIILFSNAQNGWGEDGRIAWQLVTAGYTNVKMVDGGIDAIKAAGLPTQKGGSTPVKCSVTVDSNSDAHNIDTDTLAANLNSYKVVDVRADEEYSTSKTPLYGEAKAGHVPGAIHIRYTDFFNEDGTIKSNASIEKMLTDAGISKEDQIVTYCTAGIRSGYAQLLFEMCGYNNVKNYDESMYRWAKVQPTEFE